jgi:hypothetical protein
VGCGIAGCENHQEAAGNAPYFCGERMLLGWRFSEIGGAGEKILQPGDGT